MGSSGAPGVADPNVDGPAATMISNRMFTAPSTGEMVALACHHPTTAGPFPLVLVMPGFSLPTSQFVGYAQRLASHGFAACLVAYNVSFFSPSHANAANEVRDALDWLATQTDLPLDLTRVGTLGHSLGGKLAFMVAAADARVDAVLGLDPVDTAPPGCSAQNCPDVSGTLATLAIPSGVLGETLDATAAGFGQACAPAADNFATFYAAANSPAFSVTINGANHMSFLDNVSTCGFTCSVCRPATAPNATVNGMARAYAAAFFSKTLRQQDAYDAYLTGAAAQARYVTPGLATITSK